MPISSSRRRLNSPFIGPSPSNHSVSSPKAASCFQLPRAGARTARTDVRTRTDARSQHAQPYLYRSCNGNQAAKSDAGLPILARVKPTYRQQLQVNLSESVAKPRQRARIAVQHSVRQQQGDQRSGMSRDQFALKKIRFFNSPPKPAPLTLCFSYPGYDLMHKDILSGIRRRGAVDISRVRCIQFVDMNVVLGAAGVLNRWLITLKDHDARYRLYTDGLFIKGERLCLRRYDDVNYEDYRDCLRRKNTLQSDAHTAVQRLLSL